MGQPQEQLIYRLMPNPPSRKLTRCRTVLPLGECVALLATIQTGRTGSLNTSDFESISDAQIPCWLFS